MCILYRCVWVCVLFAGCFFLSMFWTQECNQPCRACPPGVAVPAVVHSVMSVCVRERERERVFVCVCVCERERVFVCVRERERVFVCVCVSV